MCDISETNDNHIFKTVYTYRLQWLFWGLVGVVKEEIKRKMQVQWDEIHLEYFINEHWLF